MSSQLSYYNGSPYVINTPYINQLNIYYGIPLFPNPTVPPPYTISQQDIYTHSSIGVYCIRGSYDAIQNIYPIYSSTDSLAYFNIPLNQDSAYLVYPGYGFILYSGTGQTGSFSSFLYYNTGTTPFIFYTNGTPYPNSCPISTTGYGIYPTDGTQSISIFCRGYQVNNFIPQIVSGYNDTGCLISTPFYDQTGTSFPFGTYVNSKDIYINNPYIGVYMINGTYNASAIYYAVYGSCANLNYIDIPDDADDAYLVYPGYGFQLYYTTAYGSGTISHLYYNISSVPYIFYCSTSSSSSTSTWSSFLNSCPILTTSGSHYVYNNTSSIVVYYRGTQVTTPICS